jgi:hypothetical protein
LAPALPCEGEAARIPTSERDRQTAAADRLKRDADRGQGRFQVVHLADQEQRPEPAADFSKVGIRNA